MLISAIFLKYLPIGMNYNTTILKRNHLILSSISLPKGWLLG